MKRNHFIDLSMYMYYRPKNTCHTSLSSHDFFGRQCRPTTYKTLPSGAALMEKTHLICVINHNVNTWFFCWYCMNQQFKA